MNGPAFVNLTVVEQRDDMATKMSQYFPEKTADDFAIDVCVEEMAVQPNAVALGADGDSGNSGDSVVTVEMTVNGRLPTRAPCLAYRRNQQEARFVEEQDVGTQPPGVFFTRGQTVRFHSVIARSLRSAARRSGFWWLHPQLVQEFANMIPMVIDSVMTMDQFGNSQSGPQFCAVTMRHGSFQKQFHESSLLRDSQAGRSAWSRLGLKCVRPSQFCRPPPPQDATRMTPYPTGNLVQRELRLEQRCRPATAFFQNFRRTVWSHRDTPFQDVSTILHYLCGSQ